MSVGVGIIGCGYVASFYASSIALHAGLRLVAASDVSAERVRDFARLFNCRAHADTDALLADPAVDLVVNLTPAFAHREVLERCLNAGKHVYSEKPLAVRPADAAAVTELARANGRTLACAPCCVLGESAQTLWRAIREGRIGRVRAAYVEVDDGPHYRMPSERWRSVAGAPFPRLGEAELGCVLGHGGYGVSWLTALFGPVRAVTSFADALAAEGHGRPGADFAVATLSFDRDVHARSR